MSKRNAARAAFSIAAAVAVCLASAPDARAPHAKVEIVADSTAVPAEGGAVTLGVRFTIDQGWHIYWRNSGESGGPPVVTWKAPPELSIGELQWPTPERFAAPGDTTYGYQHRVMLLAPARYTGSASLGAIPIQAVIEYQICKDVCLKETARPSFTLAAGAAAPSPAAAELTEAKTRLPSPMPAAWRASALVNGADLVLTIDTGQRETAGLFFPYQPGVIQDSAAQRVEARPDGLTLRLKKARDFSSPASLDGLLVRPGVPAIEIKAPVETQGAPGLKAQGSIWQPRV